MCGNLIIERGIKMAKTTEGSSLVPGPKTQISVLEREIAKLKKEQTKLIIFYEESRKKLGKAYDNLMGLVDQLTEIKVHGTKKESALSKRIKDGKAENVRLTKVRNDYFAQIDSTKEKLSELGMQLMVLKERELNKIDSTNEIVSQVFALTEAMVQATAARDEFLKRHVFLHLLNEKGKPLSQVTFDSSDKRRRVVALVNTMTFMRSDLAEQAKREIDSFFERFQKPALTDPHIQAMMSITKEILVEKTFVKPGETLYRFISMELDDYIFPELVRAQRLLRQSIGSKQTTSYVRLLRRAQVNEKFVAVPQS